MTTIEQDLQTPELGAEVASALREITSKSLAGRSLVDYVEGELPLDWRDISEGGWTEVGIAEEDGGAGATLRDLVEIAKAWGESTAPLPLLPTLMAKRWSAPARDCESPVVLAVRTPALPEGRYLAPFGATPDAQLALGLGTDGDELASPQEPQPDGYAPTLRLAELTVGTTFAPEAAREYAVVCAAEAIGCATNLLNLSVEYVKERVQFGEPIGRKQAVKHRLANALVQLEHGESAVLWACAEPDATRRATAYALDASISVAQEAIQVHGGLGFTWEMGLHLQLRHMLTLRELIQGVLG
jgi:alkylation response protein AidB-like acyl-CoA dehydrogenase